MDAIKFQAAKDVLDRTGHKAPTKQEISVEVTTFEQQLKQVMHESDFRNDAIDAEFSEKEEQE